MPLCSTCNHFFQTQVFDFRTVGVTVDDYPHHVSILGFLKAVDQKCFICWRAFRHSFSNPAKARGHLERIARLTSSPQRVAEKAKLPPDQRCVTHVSGGHRRIWTTFNAEYLQGMKMSHEDLSDMLPDIEAVEKLIRSGAQDDNGRGAGSIVALLREPTVSDANVQSSSTASNETFTNISSWIRRCEEEHSQCTKFRSIEPWFPTRVIDVGSLGNLSVMLVPGGRAIAKDKKYMTLSHRWGSSNVPTLTTQTVDTWKTGVSVKILPQRYQDFVILAQRLQIRYVWIDSLCIIQEGDGGEDWRAEALTMDQVYQNSFCNVSADWGSGKRGLYLERDLRLVDKPQIEWKVKREPNSDLVVGEKCILVENEFWEEQVSRSPLSVRGWVVQERWLSPRNLRFGTREVFFECAQSTFCERFPDKLPKILQEGDAIHKAAFSKLQMLQNQPTARGPATPGTELYDAWGDVLAKYSRCHLTFASDRAVAFAGIAKFFKALVDDNYVAGLWLRNLASEMMWYRNRLLTKAVIEDPRDRISLFQHDQAHQYRPLSFSWASTAVPIELNHAKGNSGFLVAVKCVKFRDIQNALVEEWIDNLYGPLSHRIVEIQAIGTLKKWRLKPCFDGKETDLHVVPDGPGQDSRKFRAWSDAISRNTTEATLDFQLDKADVAAWAAKDNLYYIPWQDHWKSYLPADRNSEHPDDDFLTCLLLELVDTQMSRFRRIGRLYIHAKSQRRLYIAKQENESNLPCAHFDPMTRRHTLYII